MSPAFHKTSLRACVSYLTLISIGCGVTPLAQLAQLTCFHGSSLFAVPCMLQLETSTCREKIEALAGSLGFPLKKLYVIDGSTRSAHSNAYMCECVLGRSISVFAAVLPYGVLTIMVASEPCATAFACFP